MPVSYFKRLLRLVYAPMLRRLQRRRVLLRERDRIHAAVRQALQSANPVKIIIGAGQTQFEGWIATDVPAFDLRNSDHWRRLFPPASIDSMLAEHVFEHLPTEDLEKFLPMAGRYLAPGGRIRIAVPDGYHPNPDYIASVKPGGTGVGANDHKVLYTCDRIGDLMREQGYQFELLEYFDADGHFHQITWYTDDGFIGRSAGNDARNAGGQLNYTSLIIDCWRT